MPATVIVGLQWGDEGKGKTTDFLAEQVAMVVRYQGGDNAGHTVVTGEGGSGAVGAGILPGSPSSVEAARTGEVLRSRDQGASSVP